MSTIPENPKIDRLGPGCAFTSFIAPAVAAVDVYRFFRGAAPEPIGSQ